MYEQITIVVISLVFAAVLAGVLLVLLLVYKHLKQGGYNTEINRVEMESLRKSLEGRIYDLTDRLLSSESRWRDMNHLLLSSVKHSSYDEEQIQEVPYTGFVESFGMSKRDLLVQDDLVFVLTPFHPEYEETFKTVTEVCRKVGLRCFRGDEQYVASDLLAHILQFIVRARLIIANIDGRNPNVFYELGIAHAMGKPTILISSSLSEMPFDLKARKLIVYKTQKELQDLLHTELTRTVLKSKPKEATRPKTSRPQLQMKAVAFNKSLPKEGQAATTVEILNYSDSPAFKVEFDLKYGTNDWIKAWNRARVKDLEQKGEARTLDEEKELQYRKDRLPPLPKLEPGTVARVEITGSVPSDICQRARVGNEFPVLLKATWQEENGRTFGRVVEYRLLCTIVGDAEDYSFLSGRIVSEE